MHGITITDLGILESKAGSAVPAENVDFG